MAKTYILRLTVIAATLMVLAVFIGLGYRDPPQSVSVLVNVLAGGAVALTLVNIYLWFKYRTLGDSE